ncbi:hypothetical protein M5689_019171 [Euphorbia peplus]|nr:hypothetical protein M5689_019171 [Euphorbia peplus]
MNFALIKITMENDRQEEPVYNLPDLNTVVEDFDTVTEDLIIDRNNEPTTEDVTGHMENIGMLLFSI